VENVCFCSKDGNYSGNRSNNGYPKESAGGVHFHNTHKQNSDDGNQKKE